MRLSLAIIVLTSFAPAVMIADDDASRSKLTGTWQGDKDAQKWILDQKADAIHVTYVEGDRTVADFECNTSGRECNMKESGKSAKVSMWFAGPKLVQLET